MEDAKRAARLYSDKKRNESNFEHLSRFIERLGPGTAPDRNAIVWRKVAAETAPIPTTGCRDILRARSPRTLRRACLLSKPSRRKIDVNVEYVGFTIEDKFVVGYGLDYAEQYRNLPYIAVLGQNGF